LDNVFKRKIYEIDPYGEMKDDEVMTQIRNICGLTPSLIISDKAFEILVKKQIERFKQPTFECLNMVYQEMKRITSKVNVPEFEVFTKLAKSISDVMDEIFKRCLNPTEQMLENIFKIEKGFINTKHPDFTYQRELILANRAFAKRSNNNDDTTLTSRNNNMNMAYVQEVEPEKENFFTKLFGGDKKTSKKRYSEDNLMSGRGDIFNLGSPNDFIKQREKEELEVIKQLVNCYLQIVKKNLIDYVPKTIVTLLVNESSTLREEELVGRLYNNGNVEGLLVRNEEAFKRQQENANS